MATPFPLANFIHPMMFAYLSSSQFSKVLQKIIHPQIFLLLFQAQLTSSAFRILSSTPHNLPWKL